MKTTLFLLMDNVIEMLAAYAAGNALFKFVRILSQSTAVLEN